MTKGHKEIDEVSKASRGPFLQVRSLDVTLVATGSDYRKKGV